MPSDPPVANVPLWQPAIALTAQAPNLGSFGSVAGGLMSNVVFGLAASLRWHLNEKLLLPSSAQAEGRNGLLELGLVVAARVSRAKSSERT